MLLNLKYIKPAYQLDIKGIVHIGAHTGEERFLYKDLGIENVIWIEANPDVFPILCKNLEDFPKNKALNYLLTNEPRDFEFFVMNHVQSSSILPLDLHKKFYPNIKVKKKIKLKGHRFDDIIEKEKINLKEYNTLCLDVQGAEFHVLEGMAENLHKIKYIYTEINTVPLYKNCTLVEELDDYLDKVYGFKRELWSLTTKGWGDALYINKNAKRSRHTK